MFSCSKNGAKFAKIAKRRFEVYFEHRSCEHIHNTALREIGMHKEYHR